MVATAPRAGKGKEHKEKDREGVKVVETTRAVVSEWEKTGSQGLGIQQAEGQSPLSFWDLCNGYSITERQPLYAVQLQSS